MNMKEFLDKHPLPWRAAPMEHYNALWDELIDSNDTQVDLVDLVMAINSEFQPLNTRDLPGQSTLECMCWQEDIQDAPRTGQASIRSAENHALLNLGSALTIVPLCTGGSYIQHKPELVENVLSEYKDKIALINSLKGILTLNEARTKILGWQALEGPEGNKLFE